MSSRYNRVNLMYKLIKSGGYPSIDKFCEKLEVSKRSVFDTLAFMRDQLGAPLRMSRRYGGYYFTDPNFILPTYLMSEGDLLAFFLSVELAERYLGTAFEKPLRKAIEHFSDQLPDKIQVELDGLDQHYAIRSCAIVEVAPETLMELMPAVDHRHPIEMNYYTANRGEETHRTIHPYQLLNSQGIWYLIGYDSLRSRVLQFAVSRIRDYRIHAGKTFEIDPGYSPDDYFQQSFQSEHGNAAVEYKIQFDKLQSVYIRERTWHPTQHIEELPDGGIILTFTTGATGEVKRWIMSYGSHAKVLAPEKMVDEVRGELERCMLGYAGERNSREEGVS